MGRGGALVRPRVEHLRDRSGEPVPTCGHYTQLVWRATVRIGCGHRLCTTGTPFTSMGETWQLWVCDYDPPGNRQGQRPY